VISFGETSSNSPLSDYAGSIQGIKSGDDNKFCRQFWEIGKITCEWRYEQSTAVETSLYTGREKVINWSKKDELARLQGQSGWGKRGVVINQMASLNATLHTGELFDGTVTCIVPNDPKHLPAIWAFCSSTDYPKAVRQIEIGVAVSNAILAKVPFDLNHWQAIAAETYFNGLPKPYSHIPTQWIFHGHPRPSSVPLQVAVARLVGYTWPAESDKKIELSDEARDWIARSKELASHADNDGILCIPPVGRESSASDRLLNLLADAYGTDWSNDILAQLLSAADHAGKSLETWLRDKFFEQHCALFGNRPFVWHVWDGLRDGFSALVNYHMLDYKTLEALIYTYLGDWIGRQKRDAENGVDGAQEKLATAETLKKRLELILVGEAPYDIFVRWKPIEEQPIGWNPNLNDGVRMNIRPFLSVPDIGKRGAGVLRDKPKSLRWEKDRGSDVPSAPWYELGLQYGGKVGDRINDHYLTLLEKRTAREKAK
jgi:hypothetical protein